jgi:hypothetical protein
MEVAHGYIGTDLTVDDALDLINLAVSKLPLNIKQGIQ